MKFSETTLNEVRLRTNIVELVSEYVPLKKSGAGFTGLCPFHKEKTPSFHVHPAKNCFHCFGCHKGGNVFSFYSAIEGISFPEAVRKLADRAGVRIEEARREALKAAPIPGQTRLFDALELAARYFHHLLNESKEFAFAKKYVKERGLSETTISKFQIGVSPKGWNGLISVMTKRGFSFAELLAAGLVVEKQGAPNNGYDRFRGRLMFPIRNPDGKTVGFGARLLEDDADQPKYINSPESPLFPKRGLLYGQFENTRDIRMKGEAVVVEGYMDVVGLFDKDVRNSVATMGTALTEDHCQLLRPLTRRIVTVFDPDKAGNEAWHRSVHLLLNAGFFAKDLSLPDGKDPDEFVSSEGAEKFYELCDKAPRQITKLLKEIASKGPLSEEERTKVLSQLTPVLVASRRMPDRVLLWDSISLVLKVSVDSLKELAENPGPGHSRPATPSFPRPVGRNAAPAKTKGLDVLDLQFLNYSLKYPKLFLMLPKDMWRGRLKETSIERWLAKLSLAVGVEEFLDIVETELSVESNAEIQAKAAEKLMNSPQTEPDGTKTFEALVERLIQRGVESEIRSVSASIKLAERMGDEPEQLRLLSRLNDLRSSK